MADYAKENKVKDIQGVHENVRYLTYILKTSLDMYPKILGVMS